MQQDVRVCTRAGVRARVFVRVLEKDLWCDNGQLY